MLRSPANHRVLPALPALGLGLVLIACLIGIGRAGQASNRAWEHRPLAAPAPATFPSLPTVIVLPDTQYYASTFPDVLRAQTGWIAHNQRTRRISAVLQLGDLVDSWSDESQWNVVSSSMRALDGIVPYLVVPGNHDTNKDRDGLLDHYFLASSMPWISATMVPGKVENSYAVLDIGSIAWLVLGLEFGPRDSALAWADGVLKAHPTLPAIVVTHAYLYEDGTRYGTSGPGAADRPSSSQRFAPQVFDYTPGEGINDGEQIWRKLILPNPNVHLVFCGHDNGVAHLTSSRPDGSRVQQLLSDYQWLYQGADDYQGGSGFLRVVSFDYEHKQIQVSTYSPYLDRELTDAGNRFSLDIEL